jgi:dUTP pyrophosphatase
MIQVKDESIRPRRATRHSAGYDLHAYIAGRMIEFRNQINRLYTLPARQDVLFPEWFLVLEPGHRMLCPTGVSSELPVGIEAQIRPRSGLAWKHGITIVNSPGTVDADFRDEWMVILENRSTEPYTIQHGDRIAQFVLSGLISLTEIETGLRELAPERAGGYGSTGR